MSLDLTITNKQRYQSIDTHWLQTTGEQLVKAVCENLISEPAAHLHKKFVRQLLQRASFSLVLVSNQEIQKLNNQWRNKDAPTDVLSFALALEPPPAELPWEVGELVISVEKAAEQARDLGHSLERELAFLFVHGILHILGFDHETAPQEKEMLNRQKIILSKVPL